MGCSDANTHVSVNASAKYCVQRTITIYAHFCLLSRIQVPYVIFAAVQRSDAQSTHSDHNKNGQ